MMGNKKSKGRGGFLVLDVLKSAFEDLRAQESKEEWILTPCTVNGEKSAAIAFIKEKRGSVDVVPIFVGITPNMVLLNSKGVATECQECTDCPDADECSDGQGEDDRGPLH
jgi:hypothetical protein